MIGVSAGGMKALSAVLPALPADFALSVLVVQHMQEGFDSRLAEFLDGMSAIRVKEAEDKEDVVAGVAYIAPPGYHLLIEEERSLSLSAEPPVNFARPSIDVLFESGVDVFGDRGVGLIMTGANSDGAQGLAAVKAAGGLAIVQNPESADSPMMPTAALQVTQVDHVLDLTEIATFLARLEEAPGRICPDSTRKED